MPPYYFWCNLSCEGQKNKDHIYPIIFISNTLHIEQEGQLHLYVTSHESKEKLLNNDEVKTGFKLLLTFRFLIDGSNHIIKLGD